MGSCDSESRIIIIQVRNYKILLKKIIEKDIFECHLKIIQLQIKINLFI